jgi:hypothetical protein
MLCLRIELVTSRGCLLPRVDEEDSGVGEVLRVAGGEGRDLRSADGGDLAIESEVSPAG